jgi:hypothetical protein
MTGVSTAPVTCQRSTTPLIGASLDAEVRQSLLDKPVDIFVQRSNQLSPAD